jgi:hypothetical protein
VRRGERGERRVEREVGKRGEERRRGEKEVRRSTGKKDKTQK